MPPRPIDVIVDCCGGLDSFLYALQSIHQPFRLLGCSDSNPYCRILHRTLYGDCRQSSNILHRSPAAAPRCDLYCASPPCEPWSVAGNRAGFHDSRAKPLLKCIEYIQQQRPTAFVIENVPGLQQLNRGRDLERVSKALRVGEAYAVEAKVLNATDFNIPQHRQRLFIVGVLHERLKSQLQFPTPEPLQLQIADVLDKDNVCPADLSSYEAQNLKASIQKAQESGCMLGRHDFILNLARPGPLIPRHPGCSPCLTRHTSLYLTSRQRKLTLNELQRLQGYDRPVPWPLSVPEAEKQRIVGQSIPTRILTALFRVLLPCVSFGSAPPRVHPGSQFAGPRAREPFPHKRPGRTGIPTLLSKAPKKTTASNGALRRGRQRSAKAKAPSSAPAAFDPTRLWKLRRYIAKQRHGGKWWCYVKWEGYGHTEWDWQPLTALHEKLARKDVPGRRHACGLACICCACLMWVACYGNNVCCYRHFWNHVPLCPFQYCLFVRATVGVASVNLFWSIPRGGGGGMTNPESHSDWLLVVGKLDVFRAPDGVYGRVCVYHCVHVVLPEAPSTPFCFCCRRLTPVPVSTWWIGPLHRGSGGDRDTVRCARAVQQQLEGVWHARSGFLVLSAAAGCVGCKRPSPTIRGLRLFLYTGCMFHGVRAA